MYIKLLISLGLVLIQCRLIDAAVSVAGTDAYLAKSAAQKAALIWSNCQESAKSAGWFNKLQLLGMFLEGMCPSFRAKGDELPYRNWFFGYRKKYIHTVGAIGRVNWVSKGSHSYTGLFQGATNGFLRLSLAGEPDKSELKTIPGFGLKFVRDGIDSGNLVAMFGVAGQQSWNFFKNDFWNHIIAASGFLLEKAAQKFATATNNVQQVGLSDMARYGNDGIEVKNPLFPYKLRFHRPGGANEFPDAYQHSFLEDLKAIKKGVLYQVHAMDKPTELGGTEKYIADLVIVSPVITSKWADERMFIRHQDMGEDLMIHPEWNPFTEAFRKVAKPEVKCPYH